MRIFLALPIVSLETASPSASASPKSRRTTASNLLRQTSRLVRKRGACIRKAWLSGVRHECRCMRARWSRHSAVVTQDYGHSNDELAWMSLSQRRRVVGSRALLLALSEGAPSAYRSALLRSVRPGSCGDRLSQVIVLLAPLRAKPLQDGEMLAGFRQLTGFHVELAQVLVGALVVGIVVERLHVERQRLRVVAGLAQTEAQEIVNVGVLHTLVDHAVEVGERAFELLGFDLGAHGSQIERLRRRRGVDGVSRRQCDRHDNAEGWGSFGERHAVLGSLCSRRNGARGHPQPGGPATSGRLRLTSLRGSEHNRTRPWTMCRRQARGSGSPRP